MNSMRIGLALALGLFAAGANAAQTEAERATLGWPEASRKTAAAMVEKYGQPDAYTPTRVEWRDRGAFKRIAVNGTPNAPGVLENTVAYAVPADGIGLLSLRDCYVVPDKGAAELTAYGASEDRNVRGLDLAEKVLRGELSVEQARKKTRRTDDPFDYVHNTAD